MVDQFFLRKNSQLIESVDQGVNTWINYPNPVSPGLFAAKALINPGKGHDFHRHPEREELIVVLEGTIEQWIDQSCQFLSPGDAVVIPAGLPHASFNTGKTPALLFVTLTGAKLEIPLAEDLSTQKPWSTLRPAKL
ncbi:MAG: cupin domain-containing protein [Bacteroidetes bacterium]|nr:cupin domain-containing protein [Bacteroidota bacterium]